LFKTSSIFRKRKTLKYIFSKNIKIARSSLKQLQLQLYWQELNKNLKKEKEEAFFINADLYRKADK